MAKNTLPDYIPPDSARNAPDGFVNAGHPGVVDEQTYPDYDALAAADKRVPRNPGTVFEEWDNPVPGDSAPPDPNHIDQVAAGWAQHQCGPRHRPIPLEAMTSWHQEQERKRQAAEAQASAEQPTVPPTP